MKLSPAIILARDVLILATVLFGLCGCGGSRNARLDAQSESEVTRHVFVMDGMRYLAPQHISAGDVTVKWIFPIPEPGAIGTLDKQSNGIVFVKFGGYGKDPECRIALQNYSEKRIKDDFTYQISTIYTDTSIVYATTEYAVIANLKNKDALCVKRSGSMVKIKDGETLFLDDTDIVGPEIDDLIIDEYCIDPETLYRIPEGEECIEKVTLVNGQRVFYAADLGIDVDEDDSSVEPRSVIHSISFLNPQNNLFVVANLLDVFDEKDKDNLLLYDNFLQVVKLEGDSLVNTDWILHLGMKDIPNYGDQWEYRKWFVHDQKLFAYNQAKHKMLCTDGSAPVRHPFAEAFNAESDNIGKVKDLALHPTLPFGVMIEEDPEKGHDIILLRWDINDREKQNARIVSYCQKLLSLAERFDLKPLELAYQSFSPDGKWYVVGCFDSKSRCCPRFIAIPVISADKDHPDFLDIDNLAVLDQTADRRGVYTIAWTHEPTSYVVSDGKLLHKWDLDELSDDRAAAAPNDGGKPKRASVFRRIARRGGF
ncbi:hypothetical protein R80B4_00398 [Fibrobacteres bacterium R8-0-B4]